MTCLACGGALAPWLEVPAGEPSDPRIYPLLRCGDCGSARTAGEPPPPDAYEAGQYSPARPRAGPLVRAFQRLAMRQPVRWLRLRPGARVLDAGAGTGRLVRELRATGHEARGIDPSARSVALSNGLVERSSISDHSDSNLDAVVLWHVLEHLDDPGANLAHLRAWLANCGILLVAAPNAASLQARIAGPGWLHWDAPRHRVHFTVAGLTSLLRRQGFEVVAVHHWVAEMNPHAMWMALLSRLGMRPGFPFHFLKRNVRARPLDLALVVLGIPLIPVAIALELLAAAARRGGTVAVAARVSGSALRAERD